MASDFPAYVAAEYEHGTEVQEYTPGLTTEAFGPGDLVFYDTSDQLMQLCGADPSLIAGISEVDSEEAKTLTPNGKVPVRLLKPNALVAMCSATTPAESHVGVAYGVVTLASGNWSVDTSDTSNTRVVVKRVDIENGIFFVSFLAANLQFDAIAS